MAIKQIYGLHIGHPLQADSLVTPSSVPFDSPPVTRVPWVNDTEELAGPMLAGPTDPARVPNKINGLYVESMQLAPWFEMMHITPKSIDEGRILSTVNLSLVVHNAYRRTPINWTSFVNGGGVGTSLTGSTPPQTIQPQASILDLVYVIETDGAPVVDDDLEFVFSDGVTLLLPIEFSRLFYFDWFPEEGYTEELGFLTEVMTSKDGTEQRHALRRYPRQKFRLEFREDGAELSRLLHTLLGRSGGTWGVPLWHESTVLSSAVTGGDTVINVQSTDYRDFRPLGIAVVFQEKGVLDIMQVQSFTANTITPVNALVNSYPAGTLVMPVRVAKTGKAQRGSRWPRRGARLNIEFVVDDVDVDLADTTGWPTLNSKVLVDDGNALGSSASVREEVNANIVVLDAEVGAREQYSFASLGRYISRKSWYPSGIEKLWSVRGLIHALRGRQVSWYLPADRDNLVLVSDIVIASATFSIENAGVSYVAEDTSHQYVRVTENDGTQTTKKILSSAVSVDGLTEAVTIDGTWAVGILAADVLRVELLHKVRFASDKFQIRYERGRPGARVTAPVTTVVD